MDHYFPDGTAALALVAGGDAALGSTADLWAWLPKRAGWRFWR